MPADQAAIAANLTQVKANIAAAAQRSGRHPEEIKLVVVTKTIPAEIIGRLVNLGITDIGENKVQEAADKFSHLGRAFHWHLVGHLQSNKAKKAVEMFDLIQSVDSLSLAEELNKHAAEREKRVKILLQVNISGAASQSGLDPAELLPLAEKVHQLHFLKLEGLMAIGPLTADPEETRPGYRKMSALYAKIKKEIVKTGFHYLSLGMSSDYPEAIEEGANLVRIGQAIFGERKN